MSLSNQIENRISKIIEPLLKHKRSIINIRYVADLIDGDIDPKSKSPELKTYTSVMFLRGAVRRYLARNHDPVQKARDHIDTGQSDLFSGVLQDYYPVKRKIDGDTTLAYARRETLTDDDIDRNCLRMERAGGSLIEHSQSLRSYKKDRAA